MLTIAACATAEELDRWSPRERALIDAMRLDRLGPPPPDPSNRFADNPDAARLGNLIFHDARFSAESQISCASCHRASTHFTDDLKVARGLGETTRRTMTAVGMAYQHWFFWDGRKDSLWAQALEPLENPLEHGISRTRVSQVVVTHYRDAYEQAIGPLPDVAPLAYDPHARPAPDAPEADAAWQSIPPRDRDAITRIFVNCGKAVAAFVRTLNPAPAPLDRYARAVADGTTGGLDGLSLQQKKGLRLFIGKAQCINCHHGPLLSNGEFHHVGIPDAGLVDRGRAAVIADLATDEFSILGRWSDADPQQDGGHVRFLDASPEKYERAFKTPSLRNVAGRPPYMHAGQFGTLPEVLTHYRDVSGQPGVDEIFHGDLTDEELEHLEAFLHTLTSDAAP